MTTFTPRAWQERCRRALKADVDAGYNALLIQAATGTGKTLMFLWWLEQSCDLDNGDRALIVVDQCDLAEQAQEKAGAFFPDTLGQRAGVVMGERNDVTAQLVIATRQTLAHGDGQRLRDVLQWGAFTHWIVDEAHGDGTAQLGYIEKCLKEAEPGILKTGWTATPYRTDRNGLITKRGHQGPYDKLAFSYPVQEAVRDGALCPFKAFAVGLPVSFAAVGEANGDWNASDLGDILDAENVWEIILSVWRGETENAPDCSELPTIVFTATVEQAKHGAEYFAAHGVPAEYAHGGTSTKDRHAIKERFRLSETRVLFNCQLYTKGTDIPEISCAIQAAPTKSRLAWVQKMGRALRVDEDNPDKVAILVDLYPIERGNVFAADALGVPKEVREAKERAESEGVVIGWSMDALGKSVAIRMSDVVVKALDIMGKSGLPWTMSEDLRMTTALSAESAACICLPHPDRLAKAEAIRGGPEWTPQLEEYYDHIRRPRLWHVEKNRRGWKARLVDVFEDVESAKAVVDTWDRDQNLGRRSAPWRKRPASVKQLGFLERITHGEEHPANLTMGEASRLISQALVEQAVSKAEKEVWLSIKR